MPRPDELRAYKILNTAPSTLAEAWKKPKRIECRKLDDITAYELYTAVITHNDKDSRGYFVRVAQWQADGTSEQLSNKYYGELIRAIDDVTALKSTYKLIPREWE